MHSVPYDQLIQPLPRYCFKALYYKAINSLMRGVGRWSTGIDLGYRYGFDSGVMLEYVYCNQAQGRYGIGVWLDRLYLNAPGWVGIRQRGELVREELKALAREKARNKSGPVKIVDLACGGGRYVLEALRDLSDLDVQAILRDYRVENVCCAQTLAQDMGIQAIIEQADAFSDDDLALILKEQPDIVVVSGLHEIIDNDGLVARHLRQIAAILGQGGSLLLTIQPEHPQLEFIARVLPSHTGRMWVMRLRPCELTRRWVEEAGLYFVGKKMENKGIFGVIRVDKLV
ncbi:MAG: class I SAM-dependent methyltransferase family protein [Micavibrio aeruginosavorus]|uniref:Class I SAM-dependent methyltransferase family protein n=1 Tax=Micavibrio aeruginosavorus TaxID=349221 RepID=A0A7T5R1J0_9BACT|nr:MAG: class I SAM-dependent methyltransferase family protein [Micavibrio aeruginosavorus]